MGGDDPRETFQKQLFRDPVRRKPRKRSASETSMVRLPLLMGASADAHAYSAAGDVLPPHTYSGQVSQVSCKVISQPAAIAGTSTSSSSSKKAHGSKSSPKAIAKKGIKALKQEDLYLPAPMSKSQSLPALAIGKNNGAAPDNCSLVEALQSKSQVKGRIQGSDPELFLERWTTKKPPSLPDFSRPPHGDLQRQVQPAVSDGDALPDSSDSDSANKDGTEQQWSTNYDSDVIEEQSTGKSNNNDFYTNHNDFKTSGALKRDWLGKWVEVVEPIWDGLLLQQDFTGGPSGSNREPSWNDQINSYLHGCVRQVHNLPKMGQKAGALQIADRNDI